MIKANEKEVIIFLHIPKAAGSTIHKILERHYSFFRRYLVGSDIAGDMGKFKNFSEKKRNSYDLIRGHLSFGLEGFISRPVKYFTIVRNPLERLYSHYNYVRRTSNHYLNEHSLNGFKNYIEKANPMEMANGQVRMISGAGGNIHKPTTLECDRKMLEKAKENIEKYFSLVGIDKYFDESLILLKKEFGWKNICYISQNVTGKEKKKTIFDDETLKRVKELNELDYELYSYAEKLFEEKIKTYDGDFKKDLKEFKKMNEAYGKVFFPFEKIKHIIKKIIGKE